jgi:hypothetical protein
MLITLLFDPFLSYREEGTKLIFKKIMDIHHLSPVVTAGRVYFEVFGATWSASH